MNSTSVFHIFFFFLCLVQIIYLSDGAKCISTERQALLAFKAGLKDPSGSLASWTGQDCCKWSGIRCDTQTGRVDSINLSNKSLQGELTFGVFQDLHYLDLSNNQFHGKLPLQLKSPDIRSVRLSYNQFEGALPSWSLNAITELYLEHNHFSGSIPENMGQLMPKLVRFFVSWNDLTGKIPAAMCDMNDLQILSLRSNQISGEIPDCWHTWMFWAIDVSNNRLTGKIPTSFGSLPSLSVVLLAHNDLDGEIPSTLQKCSGLTNIDLSGNKFSGSLPPWIGEKLASLFMLSLSSNSFSGTIPKEFCIPANLHILDLSYNSLSGQIPNCIGNLTGFVNGNNTQAYEDLLYMATRGKNPEYGDYIAKINTINLSHNKFSGGIPEGLANLISLNQLNLSYNNLAGKIPARLKFKTPATYEVIRVSVVLLLRRNAQDITEN